MTLFVFVGQPQPHYPAPSCLLDRQVGQLSGSFGLASFLVKLARQLNAMRFKQRHLRSIVRLDLGLDLFHAVELFFVFFKRLGQDGVLGRLRRAEEVLLQRLGHALAVLNQLVFALVQRIHTLVSTSHLAHQQCLVFLVLPLFALQVLLLDPGAASVVFLPRNHRFIEREVAAERGRLILQLLPLLVEALVALLHL